jgi:hypothetical protein
MVKCGLCDVAEAVASFNSWPSLGGGSREFDDRLVEARVYVERFEQNLKKSSRVPWGSFSNDARFYQARLFWVLKSAAGFGLGLFLHKLGFLLWNIVLNPHYFTHSSTRPATQKTNGSGLTVSPVC